jgi:hypothetical protein
VKRPARFFATLFAVLLLLMVGGYFKMKHDLNRAVGVFANVTQHVIGPSAKAAVAPVVVSPRDVVEPGVVGGHGALGQYPSGSEAAAFNSKITDTWISGMAAGKAVLETTKANQMQASALDIPEVPAPYRLDGWGNPFCIKKSGPNVLLVIGGPKPSQAESCQAQKIAMPDPASTPRGKIIRLTGGEMGLFLRASSSSDTVDPSNGNLHVQIPVIAAATPKL